MSGRVNPFADLTDPPVFTPKPKKERPTSARIRLLTLMVASMIRNDDMLGRIWRKIIFQCDTPMKRAAAS